MKFPFAKPLIIFTFCIGIHTFTYTQSQRFLVKDHENLPLIGATLKLTALPDSIIKYSTTNNAGIAVFESVKNGLYEIQITYVGFETITKNISIKPERKTMDFKMSQQSVSLGEVAIVARRPLIRQEDDKTIIDPEPIAETSTNTLEILESTPGIYVDQDGGIFLSGATPAAVYINGREQKMSAQDITTLLRSLPPGSVQHIEILRTPSTKYDAASSGGILNIVLKKGVKIGRFMTLTAGMNQGKYGNRFIGYSLNNSGEKSTQYLNINYNYNDFLEELNSTRQIKNDTLLRQEALNRSIRNQLYVGYGINYDLKENITFNYDGRLNGGLPYYNSTNKNKIYSSQIETILNSDNFIDSENQTLNIQQDLGLIIKLDSLGSNIDIKTGYSYIQNTGNQEIKTDYINPMPFTRWSNANNQQERHFGLFQADVTYQLPLKIKTEFGGKSTFQRYYSDADFFETINENSIKDTNRSNAFKHTEWIHAAYFQASRTLWAGLLFKAGVRLENTNMQGIQKLPADTGFTINRTDWFPYVYLSRKLFSISKYELRAYAIYRKTINRPGYDLLNPYIRYVDQFLYETGNPALTPQFTENIELNISFDETPLFAIGQNYTTDIFSNVTYRDERQEGVALRTYDNIGKGKETYFRAIAGIPPGKMYFFALGAQYNMNEYDGWYDNMPIQYKRDSWRFFTFHSLNITKQTKLTMSGFMMLNGFFNFYELEDFGAINFGLNQSFFDRKLNITLNARDVFRTMITKFELNQGTIYAYGDRYTDNQRFGINIRFNFGVRKPDNNKKMFEFNGEEPMIQ